jgi:F0F1-type ATP synthase assembly protein I
MQTTTPPDKPTGGEPGPPELRPKSSGQEDLSSWFRMTGLGLEFIAAVAVIGGIGWWADKRFGTLPWLTLVGAALGFAVGLWTVVKAAMKSFK